MTEGRVLSSEEFHYCEPPEAERYNKRWWTDPDLPWFVCMFCGVRRMKAPARVLSATDGAT